MDSIVVVVMTVIIVIVAAVLAFLRKWLPSVVLFLVALAAGVAVTLDHYGIVNV